MRHRVHLNYGAVVVAGIAYWFVQAGWYTLFARQWVAAIGKTMAELQQKGSSPIPYIGSLICDLLVALALAWILARIGEPSAAKGAAVGAALTLGFVSTALMTQYLFEQRPVSLFLINSGGALLGTTLMGVILGTWKAKAAVASAVSA